jgi:hypothetical protein
MNSTAIFKVGREEIMIVCTEDTYAGVSVMVGSIYNLEEEEECKSMKVA